MTSKLILGFCIAFAFIAQAFSKTSVITRQEPPTVYEYYEGEGRVSGLEAESDGFKLNGKPIRIVSGAMHYFRIHPAYWRDRLRKLRASGANTLETYVPWNLHEPLRGVYDFGNGTFDMSSFLDLRAWIQMAQEEDLLVIFRPGPYICSEWDFGGLPSWIVNDPEVKVRESNAPYEERVKLYFDLLLPLVADLQWSNGGSIIMIQIENEYGAFGTLDKRHLEYLKALMETNGMEELFVTSDSPLTNRDKGALPGVLQSANFYDNAAAQLNALLELQPDKPVLVMEYWSGWFDHWFEPFHNARPDIVFENNLEIIYRDYNGSVNFYMFHGGTSFNFLAGANVIDFFPNYLPDVSSYDYDAPLSEAGDYSEKYHILRNLTEKYSLVELNRPEMPAETLKTAYANVTLQTYLSYEDIIDRIPPTSKFTFNRTVSMEMLPMNGGSGQSYGYIIYRVKQPVGDGSIVEIGRARDMATLLVDGVVKSNAPNGFAQLVTDFGYWTRNHQEQIVALDSDPEVKLRNIDLLVENAGRVNFGGPEDFKYQKGLHEGNISVDGVVMTEIETMALEFKSEWVKSLTGWKNVADATSLEGPLLIQSTFEVASPTPTDTWLNMRGWHKGIVFINGFNLGRYFKVGPPHTLFIPAPLLVTGVNTITIFEQYKPDVEIHFSEIPILGNFQ